MPPYLDKGCTDCRKPSRVSKGKPLRERIKWASNVFWLEGEKLEYTEFADLGVRVYGFSYHSREIQGSTV